MYVPAHFALQERDDLHRVMREHPLGLLVRQEANSLDADHIPFEFDPNVGTHGLLTGHVARANPIWESCPSGSAVLVVFRGDDAYVSPNWYPSKHEAHRQVPTWNYEVVHAHGVIRYRHDEAFKRGIVARLTRRHEASEPRPWKMGDSEPHFIHEMLEKIVGLEIEVTQLVGKAKLSQNREPHDRASAADQLALKGHLEVAERMRRGL